jgi:hypothetical protein
MDVMRGQAHTTIEA